MSNSNNTVNLPSQKHVPTLHILTNLPLDYLSTEISEHQLQLKEPEPDGAFV